jgi:glycosyltransferase involved in cell wall biosynthesis
MAAGLPLIASRVGGVPEMIVDGKNGILIEPEDIDGLTKACLRLLKNPAERATMRAEGSRIVNQTFSVEHQVKQLMDLYLAQLQAYGKS